MKLKREAARWFARMQGAGADHPDRSRFEAWLSASPAHTAEYAAFVDMWQGLDAQGDEVVEVMNKRRERQRLSRRAVLKRGTMAAILASVGGSSLSYYLRYRTQWHRTYTTRTREVASETLQDGSVLVRGAGSELSVDYSHAERYVTLRAGEASFDVQPDSQRPFVVDNGPVRITVLGTRFAVNALSTVTRVSVDHGRVQLEVGGFWNAQDLVLETGQVGEVMRAPEDISGRPRRVERKAEDGFAFERGMIMFDQAGLAEVAETLSRYRSEPVRLRAGAGNAAAIHLVAGIRPADVERFIDSLPTFASVAVDREGDAVWLVARNGH